VQRVGQTVVELCHKKVTLIGDTLACGNALTCGEAIAASSDFALLKKHQEVP
jgi:hypothetical protein